MIPRTVLGIQNNRQHKLITVRPITKSQIAAIRNWITDEKWANVINENDLNSKLEMFTTMTFTMLDAVAPTKQVKIACDEPAWMNKRIKTYIRKRNREYNKNCNSVK